MTSELWNSFLKLVGPSAMLEAWRAISRKEQIDVEDFELDEVLKNIGLMSELAREPNLHLHIFDMNRLEVIWTSKNGEAVFGVSDAEMAGREAYMIFKYIRPEHRMFLFQSTLLSTQFMKKISVENGRGVFRCQSCGMKGLNPKTGEINRFMLRQHCIKQTKNGYPILYLGIFENVTHLMKGDDYWCRYEGGTDYGVVPHFRSGDFFTTKGDLISKRELEILHLMNHGLETIEIAEKLFISTHTVEKHRKNMLENFGAKNSTALLQLARMCRLV